MKREVIFITIWSGLAYLFLYLYSRFSIIVNNTANDSFKISFLNFNILGVLFLGIVIMGLFIGVFALNIRYFSKTGIILSVIFALYLVLKFPLYKVLKNVDFMYPRWMFMNVSDMSTNFGGMILAILVINVWKVKLTFLELGDTISRSKVQAG